MSEALYLIPSTSQTITISSPIFGDGKIDHVARALSRLPEQLRRSTAIVALLQAMLSPAQEIEDMFYALLALKSIDDAEGATLDLIGKLVGQARNGQTDTVYRSFIRVKLAVNKSRGLHSDYVKICRLLHPTANIEVRAQGATAVVTVRGVVIDADGAQLLLGFLTPAHGAGVRVVLQTFPTAEAVAFSYRSASHLLSGISIGATSFALITQKDLLTFPPSGFVKIDSEVIAYTINVPTWTLMQVKTPGVTANHSAGAIVALCDAAGVELNTGRGFGNGFYSSGLESTT